MSSLTMSWLPTSRVKPEAKWCPDPKLHTGSHSWPRRDRHHSVTIYRKYFANRCLKQCLNEIVVAVSQSEANIVPLEQRFYQLADAWTQETGPISSIDDRIAHQAYRDIIALGWDVVPYLIADLQHSHRFWFPALAEITKIQPFDRSDVGNIRRMTSAWTAWWKKRKEMM